MLSFIEFMNESVRKDLLDVGVRAYKLFIGPGHNLTHSSAVKMASNEAGIDSHSLQTELSNRASYKNTKKLKGQELKDWYLRWEEENNK